MMEFVLILAVFGLLGATASVFGTDSRDGDDWSIHPPA
jgi:hypothetical protein